MLQKNQEYLIEIQDITNEGNGVGRLDGVTVFVPLAAVGDLLRIRIVKVQKSYCYGKIVEIVKPSPDRIPIDCTAFMQCGGCSYRHITYESELQIKEKQVRDCFVRIGRIDIPQLPIIGCKQIEGYRNKAQYPVGLDKDGNLTAGFYANRSHRLISSEMCRLQPAVFEIIKRLVLNYIQENKVTVYDETTGSGLLRHIYLRQAEQTGEIMVTLVAAEDNLPNLEDLIETLIAKVPQIVSIVVNVNDQKTNVILGKTCRTLYGKGTITDILCGRRITLSPLSFYQVNRRQAERLYQTAEEFAFLTGTETLVDLYCGAGTIGLSMAHSVKQLIGVEVVPQAVENARRNAADNEIHNARFLCADAAQATQTLLTEGIHPDVVIIDPPRKGCAASVIADIVKMAPSRVVMISCNPATAARDAAIFETKGYRAEKIQAVDLFPRTVHVECVVLMTRK